MKTVVLMGLGALLSLSTMVGCAASSEEPSTSKGTQEVNGGKGENNLPSPTPLDDPNAPAPSSDPSKPAPNPNPTICTALPTKPAGTAIGMANPAAVYCTDMGYSLDGETCTFKDGATCEQWAFFRGECGQAHSFCNLNGGVLVNKTEDMGTWTASYALCQLPNGKECQEDVFAHSCSCE